VDLTDILVVLDKSTASEERLRVATLLARKHRGSLSAAFLQNEQGGRFLPDISVLRLGLTPPVR
jgi:hypothetical protein